VPLVMKVLAHLVLVLEVPSACVPFPYGAGATVATGTGTTLTVLRIMTASLGISFASSSGVRTLAEPAVGFAVGTAAAFTPPAALVAAAVSV